MGPRDLKAYKIYEGERVSLEFEGGVTVSGEIVTGTRNLRGEIILITFKDCKVTHGDAILFLPEWGLYHMAVGEKIVSAFNGPADLNSFNLVSHELSPSAANKSQTDSKRLQLQQYYKQIREFREGVNTTISRNKVFKEIRENYPQDWLLSLELYELANMGSDSDFAHDILQHLETVKLENPKVAHLIDDGLALIQEDLAKTF
jgi:phenylalanine-4-hydroxylase